MGDPALGKLGHLPGGEAADAEVGDLEPGRGVGSPLHQDVGRFQVAVDDRRVESVGGPDDLGELADQLGRLRRGGTLAATVPGLDQAGQVAPLDVLVDQAVRLGAQVRVEQADDARVQARAHEAVEELDLVAEQPCGCRVVAELDGRRRPAALIDVAGLPDLAEAADAEEPLQLPVKAGGPVAGLEAGQPGRQQADQLVGRARDKVGRDGRARRVALPPERGANRGRDHREIADYELADRLGLVGGDLGHNLRRERRGLAVRDQDHGLDLGPPLGLGPRAGPGVPDIPADLRQHFDDEIAHRQPTCGHIDHGLGDEAKESDRRAHGASEMGRDACRLSIRRGQTGIIAILGTPGFISEKRPQFSRETSLSGKGPFVHIPTDHALSASSNPRTHDYAGNLSA